MARGERRKVPRDPGRETPSAAGTTDRAAFVALSAALTGFTPTDLEGTGVVDTLLQALDTHVGAQTVRDLLTAAQPALAQPAGPAQDTAITALLDSPKLGEVVANLVFLWYTGKWKPMSNDWQSTYHVTDPAAAAATVSPEAYIESLVWRAIGAHPPGAKPPGFASWSGPPSEPARVLPLAVAGAGAGR